ncbi:epi-neemfruitin B synthase L1AT-like [Rutidosis leptorrhynchoides]|uniref:epi-neemfruitin B synthase L1AT-like n=1 Tax=Rutidosis leptorrhynchoides TaxID=125765 RepID=UPI003A996FCD
MTRFGRIRLLHTIISTETIKPSSSTPSHLKTHMLSVLDHIAPNIHLPWLFFYQNYKNNDIEILKKSLSQSLTHYHTFAGRHPSPFAPHIDCNDKGVVFMEASNDRKLDDFINIKDEHDKTLDQLIPNSLGCANNKSSPNMMEVQLNHFTCGGAALVVTISHKVADAFTMVKFMNHWANVARGGSAYPTSFSSYIGDMKLLERLAAAVQLQPKREEVKLATKRFVFPNSKLHELKRKINAICATPVNPSRVESLSSLLYKCAVDAAATISSCFQPSSLTTVVNLRNKVEGTLIPDSTVGNFVMGATAKMADSNQIKWDYVITSLRKEIMELRGSKDNEELDKKVAKNMLSIVNNRSRNYVATSVCRFPFYQVDFGWGKPVLVILRSENTGGDLFVLMDAPHTDGIEATVQLDEKEMAIFQKDKELLAYVEDI